MLITPEIPGVSKSASASSEENRQRTELALAALPPHTGRVYTDGSLHTVNRTPRASLTTRPAHPHGGVGAIFYHNDGSTIPKGARQASSATRHSARPIRQSWWHLVIRHHAVSNYTVPAATEKFSKEENTTFFRKDIFFWGKDILVPPSLTFGQFRPTRFR